MSAIRRHGIRLWAAHVTTKSSSGIVISESKLERTDIYDERALEVIDPDAFQKMMGFELQPGEIVRFFLAVEMLRREK